MTTSPTTRDVRKLTARIGAEVIGVDITQPLDEESISFVREALHEHKALVFTDAPLDDAAQERFAASFGELTEAHPTIGGVDGAPTVLSVDSQRFGGSAANHWHTDVTFVEAPPKATTLASKVAAPYGGETLISSTAAAYRDLPEPLRRLADGLRAVHTNDYDYAVPPEGLDDNARARREEFIAQTFETEHPVVRVHPETGERGLYLGGFVSRFVGLSTTESRDILRLLQAYITRPENIVRVSWEPHQLVIFDNQVTQHYAPDNYDFLPRLLHRVTVAGEVPFGVDGERSRSIRGDASRYAPAH